MAPADIRTVIVDILERIAPDEDLSNLDDIVDASYEQKGRSLLVEVPIDADQMLGLNPRLNNLTTKTYL